MGRGADLTARYSPRRLVRLAARTLAGAIGLLPRHRRFGAAARIAYAATAFRYTRGTQHHAKRFRVDGPHEVMLLRLLDVLTRYGCTFDPNLNVEGAPIMQTALDAKRGVMLLGPHAFLNFLVIRHLHDIGHPPLILARAALPLLGTPLVVNTLAPTKRCLMRVRSTLQSGEVVGAMIDRRDGTYTDALVRFALRLGTSIVFTSAHVDSPSSVTVTLGQPLPSSTTVDAVMADFLRFTHKHTETVFRQTIADDPISGWARTKATSRGR